MRRLTLSLVLIHTFIVCAFTWSENIYIVSPYIGPITHSYEDSDTDISTDGNGILYGLYMQMVNPEYFQFNTFLYYSPDTNFSKLVGGHFNFDYYFLNSDMGNFVVGTGIEYLDLKMDAGEEFFPLENFNLDNRIFVNYYRAGYKFQFPSKNIRFTVFPWAGIQYDLINGSLEFDADFDGPGPAPSTTIKEDIDEKYFFEIAGINLKLNLFHFIDLEAKYRATFNADDYLSNYSALANFYMTKSLGLTYRFKYSEQTSGYEIYHLFGVVYVLRK